MRNAWTIAKREFTHYFVSPIAYAVGFMILGILGLLFFINVDLSSQQSAVAIPLITHSGAGG